MTIATERGGRGACNGAPGRGRRAGGTQERAGPGLRGWLAFGCASVAAAAAAEVQGLGPGPYDPARRDLGPCRGLPMPAPFPKPGAAAPGPGFIGAPRLVLNRRTG
ncbi:hypothetical protein GCM10018785_49330 [Streptomyces longispororuber]|uniref:Uncharacterized protein n=1 Tax=Streptomyces longispororuber TaxID=68230 RepID=A0A919DRK7_9ACTN|nr:hypothetical protein GCM10018785_49330 [Streptomyces longispororuber]